jgi:hypothetical protein
MIKDNALANSWTHRVHGGGDTGWGRAEHRSFQQGCVSLTLEEIGQDVAHVLSSTRRMLESNVFFYS